MRPIFVLLTTSALLIVAFVNCSSSPRVAGPVPQPGQTNYLEGRTELHRKTNSLDFFADHFVDKKLKLQASEIQVTAAGAAIVSVVSETTSDSQFDKFRIEIKPESTSRVVSFELKYRDQQFSREALILGGINEKWDQPEPVLGAVNTGGWEDSMEVSPDGQYLFVSTYLPVSLICCLSGKSMSSVLGSDVCPGVNTDADLSGVACNSVTGPFGSPLRPAMYGGERVVSATRIQHICPKLGIGTEVAPLPPATAFGFKKLADGSFGEPFVVGFDNDGCTWQAGGFGYNFFGPIQNKEVQIVLAYSDPLQPSTANDLFTTTVQLEVPNNLGTYFVENSVVKVKDFRPTRLNLTTHSGFQGNPYADAKFLWFDTEGAGDDLWVAKNTTGQAIGPYQAAKKVPWSQTGIGETQPYFSSGRLYYSLDFAEIRSAALTGSDPALVSAWSDNRFEIRVDGTGKDNPRGIYSIGETSIAHDSNQEWLYFVYSHKTPKGMDANVGRVRAR